MAQGETTHRHKQHRESNPNLEVCSTTSVQSTAPSESLMVEHGATMGGTLILKHDRLKFVFRRMIVRGFGVLRGEKVS